MAVPGKRLRSRSPRLAHFLRTAFPGVRRRKRVWQPFLHWSELPQGIAGWAVMAGKGPIVGISARKKVNGFFDPDISDSVVWLSDNVVRAFESQRAGSAILVESTLLHELVHWGNYWGNYLSRYALDSRRKLTKKQGKPGYVVHDGRKQEVGKLFERAAYGRDINYRNMKRIYRKLRCGSCRR